MRRDFRAMLRSPMVIIVGVILLWFIAVFLVLPNVTMLVQTFFPGGHPSLRAVTSLIHSKRAMTSLRNSFILAIALSVTVNAVGVFIVLVTRYFRIRGARLLWLGYATTLIYGGVVAVAGYKFVFGPQGFVTRYFTAWFPTMDRQWFTGAVAVILVMTLTGTGQHLLFLSAALAKVDYQTVESARQMGASSFTVLRRVVIPTIKPMLFAITILTFLSGLGAFAAPQILGGTSFQTISPMILTFASIPSSRDLAAMLALTLGVSTLVLLAVLNRMQKGGTYFSIAKVPTTIQLQRIDNRFANAAVHIVAYLLFLLYVIPPALIVLFSFTNAATIQSGRLTASSFTLSNYARVLMDPTAYQPLLVSLAYGAATAVVVIVGMVFVARILQRYTGVVSTVVEYLLHIPWVLPSALMALGFILTFSVPQPAIGNAVLTGTVLLLGLAYVVHKIPFTLRLLKAAFVGIPDTMEEAATILGAGSFYTFRRILLPLVIPTAAAITALNFNSILAEYDISVFLAHPLFQPLGIVIQNATKGEGTLGDSTALTFVYTVILMVISTVTMWLVYGRSTKNRADTGH